MRSHGNQVSKSPHQMCTFPRLQSRYWSKVPAWEPGGWGGAHFKDALHTWKHLEMSRTSIILWCFGKKQVQLEKNPYVNSTTFTRLSSHISWHINRGQDLGTAGQGWHPWFLRTLAHLRDTALPASKQSTSSSRLDFLTSSVLRLSTLDCFSKFLSSFSSSYCLFRSWGKNKPDF